MNGGDVPLLEDMASGIVELFQKKNNVTSQVQGIPQSTVSPHKAFHLLLCLFFYHGDLPHFRKPESYWEASWSEKKLFQVSFYVLNNWRQSGGPGRQEIRLAIFVLSNTLRQA